MPKNVADSLEQLNEDQRRGGSGWIGGIITAEDGSFVRSNITEEYFEKLRKAFFIAEEMGFPTKKEDGMIDLEDYFDENLEALKELVQDISTGAL